VAWRGLAAYEIPTCDFAHRRVGVDAFPRHDHTAGRRRGHHDGFHRDRRHARWGVRARSAIPFSYSITYDTSLGAMTAFSAAGTSTVHDFYGYSRAGIVASSLTFGSATWTANDLRPLDINGSGLIADFFVNTDLTVAAPTLIWSSFRTSQSRLVLGLANATSSGIEMSTRVFIIDQGNPSANTLANGSYTMTSSMTPVPEPSSMLLLGAGLIGTATRLRRRFSRQR
jgi:hypothetical protein